jgi:hypothetical protein
MLLLVYTKNIYILQLLLNVVTAGIEALVSGNKFLYVCVKEVCRLWDQPRFDTFRQLLIFVGALWSQADLQVGKHMGVARREIRTKDGGQTTPSWNAPSSDRVRVAVCGRALYVSIPCLLFWMVLLSYFSVSQYAFDLIVVLGCMNSIISTPFLLQKTSCHQLYCWPTSV